MEATERWFVGGLSAVAKARATAALIAGVALFAATPAAAADRQCKGDAGSAARSYSNIVVTGGMGRTVWLAGLTTLRRADGSYIGNDFEAQVDEIFRLMDERLRSVEASMADIVKMTVYVSDGRYHARFGEMRKKYFPSGCYPASDFVVAGFPQPDVVVEVAAIAQTER